MRLGTQMKQKFYEEGHVLPTCINPGCSRPVMVRDWKNWSIKSECGTCYKARVTGFFGPAMAGITIHKKEFCSMVSPSSLHRFVSLLRLNSKRMPFHPSLMVSTNDIQLSISQSCLMEISDRHTSTSSTVTLTNAT